MRSPASSDRSPPALLNLRQAQKAGTRARIVAAATALFARHGFHSTTIDQIASASAISRQGFYLHFADKDGLLGAIVDDYYPRVSAQFDGLPGPAPSHPDIERWLQDWAAFSRRERDTMMVLREVASTANGRSPIVHTVMERLMRALALRIPAFAMTQREGATGLEARARAELLMVAVSWTGQVVSESVEAAYADTLIIATADMIHAFVHEPRFTRLT